MKWLYIVLISIAGFCLVIIQSVQSIQIYNLEIEVEKQKQINENIRYEMELKEQRAERMIDSCLDIIENGAWE